MGSVAIVTDRDNFLQTFARFVVYQISNHSHDHIPVILSKKRQRNMKRSTNRVLGNNSAVAFEQHALPYAVLHPLDRVRERRVAADTIEQRRFEHHGFDAAG